MKLREVENPERIYTFILYMCKYNKSKIITSLFHVEKVKIIAQKMNQITKEASTTENLLPQTLWQFHQVKQKQGNHRQQRWQETV